MDDSTRRNLVTAASRMLRTSRLREGLRVGLYWEAYDMPIGQTADVAVTIVPGSVQRRAGEAAWRWITRARP